MSVELVYAIILACQIHGVHVNYSYAKEEQKICQNMLLRCYKKKDIKNMTKETYKLNGTLLSECLLERK